VEAVNLATRDWLDRVRGDLAPLFVAEALRRPNRRATPPGGSEPPGRAAPPARKEPRART
jgi:hypothetical protein